MCVLMSEWDCDCKALYSEVEKRDISLFSTVVFKQQSFFCSPGGPAVESVNSSRWFLNWTTVFLRLFTVQWFRESPVAGLPPSVHVLCWLMVQSCLLCQFQSKPGPPRPCIYGFGFGKKKNSWMREGKVKMRESEMSVAAFSQHLWKNAFVLFNELFWFSSCPQRTKADRDPHRGQSGRHCSDRHPRFPTWTLCCEFPIFRHDVWHTELKKKRF